jgi:hypothetical protein
MKAAVLVGLACFSVAASEPLRAQTAPGIALAAQSLVHQRDGAVHGCGVRLTGGEASASGASTWFDVSFNVFRRGVALAQSIAYEIRKSGAGVSRPARVPVQSTWLRATGANAKLGENIERRDTLVYPLVLDDALSLFEAVASGRVVSVGIKRFGQPSDTVYTGAPELTAEARAQIGECLARLTE